MKFLPGRLRVGQRPLEPYVEVRILSRQQLVLLNVIEVRSKH